MKSWKAVRFGTPEEALRIQELEIPGPGDGQVAIKVRAAGVSLPDLLMIKGQHPLIKSTPFSPGIEVAGTVSAVGNGAPFAVGDRESDRHWKDLSFSTDYSSDETHV